MFFVVPIELTLDATKPSLFARVQSQTYVAHERILERRGLFLDAHVRLSDDGQEHVEEDKVHNHDVADEQHWT
eukprot:CAMPEP_0179887450 /NCGR_PEP_ID=MMETSP0982-20121206/31418_1 /TAXON_ID=483367 /ORGANISM="non described non described, Strain CCMP 2436" /LENGTH=72 /DNA_ID=CAMNT_0021783293 /DNA_START=295 /DNA_END=516 /DNA_ORIENTATION=+